jgi:hypothetical protein
MRKIAIGVTVFLLFNCCSSKAQINADVLNLFKEDFQSVAVFQLIFNESELIQFCKDSIGRNSVSKKLRRFEKSLPIRSAQQNLTDSLLLSILAGRLDKHAVLPAEDEGYAFLKIQIGKYKINRTLKVETYRFLLDDRQRDLATKEACDVSITKYALFLNDPNLSIREIRTPSSNFRFPLRCTIQDFDVPEALRDNIKKGLIAFLQDFRSSDLKEVLTAVQRAKVSGANN